MKLTDIYAIASLKAGRTLKREVNKNGIRLVTSIFSRGGKLSRQGTIYDGEYPPYTVHGEGFTCCDLTANDWEVEENNA